MFFYNKSFLARQKRKSSHFIRRSVVIYYAIWALQLPQEKKLALECGSTIDWNEIELTKGTSAVEWREKIVPRLQLKLQIVNLPSLLALKSLTDRDLKSAISSKIWLNWARIGGNVNERLKIMLNFFYFFLTSNIRCQFFVISPHWHPTREISRKFQKSSLWTFPQSAFDANSPLVIEP